MYGKIDKHIIGSARRSNDKPNACLVGSGVGSTCFRTRGVCSPSCMVGSGSMVAANPTGNTAGRTLKEGRLRLEGDALTRRHTRRRGARLGDASKSCQNPEWDWVNRRRLSAYASFPRCWLYHGVYDQLKRRWLPTVVLTSCWPRLNCHCVALVYATGRVSRFWHSPEHSFCVTIVKIKKKKTLS
jgi:hypothetical protein